VQEHDGVTLTHLHVRHLAAEDPPLLLVREFCSDHVVFSCHFQFAWSHYDTPHSLFWRRMQIGGNMYCRIICFCPHQRLHA
jgi:hypothetical protein